MGRVPAGGNPKAEEFVKPSLRLTRWPRLFAIRVNKRLRAGRRQGEKACRAGGQTRPAGGEITVTSVPLRQAYSHSRWCSRQVHSRAQCVGASRCRDSNQKTRDVIMEHVAVYAASAPHETRRLVDDRGKTYTIGDLAREFGVSLRTLRFYEDRGLLNPRRIGSSRLYDARDRERLMLILKGKRLGFTLTEIRALLQSEERGNDSDKLQLSPKQIDEQIAHLERQRSEIETAIGELKAQRQKGLAS
jgi:DNA-binding transcriptional MerR regulator